MRILLQSSFKYSPKESFKSIDLKANSSQLISSICDPVKKPLYKFITHGFAETWRMEYRWNWVEDMKNAMLNSTDSAKLCIIAVDWEDLARGGKVIMNYWKAIDNMKIAADIMTNYLLKNKINEKNFHCIGFSLGAHMCSVFYKTYFTKSKLKPARITGLDPAGPFFASKPTSEKLHFTDADLVDIIHTSESFGLPEKNGHMDFYPDLGPSNINVCSDIKDRFENQENVILYEESNGREGHFNDVLLNSTDFNESGGFNKISLNSLKSKLASLFNKVLGFLGKNPKRVFVNVHQFFGCSHLMSVRYFIYSINECDFKASMCKTREEYTSNKCVKSDLARMGYNADKSANSLKTSFGDFSKHYNKATLL